MLRRQGLDQVDMNAEDDAEHLSRCSSGRRLVTDTADYRVDSSCVAYYGPDEGPVEGLQPRSVVCEYYERRTTDVRHRSVNRSASCEASLDQCPVYYTQHVSSAPLTDDWTYSRFDSSTQLQLEVLHYVN